MKTPALSATFAFYLLSTASQATVWRVNYNQLHATNCSTCKFGPTGVQQAINLADEEGGDTIQVEPSQFVYDAINVTKPVTIIGAGFMHGPAATQNPDLQANPNYSRIFKVVFAPGSAGSTMTGIVFGAGSNIVQGIEINASNITIDRNMRAANANNSTIYITGTNLMDITISRNYLRNIAEPGGAQTISNLRILNNYFEVGVFLNDATDSYPNLLVQNNTFNGNTVNELYTATFVYNILAQGSVVLNNNDIHHNIAVSTTGLPTSEGPTNQNGITPLFVGTGSDDAKWKLQANSPAIDYMDTNVQLGMYGGANPYILSGIPAIPTIYQLQTTVSTTVGGTVDVTLSTKTNN